MMLQRVSLALIVEAGGTASYGTAQVKKKRNAPTSTIILINTLHGVYFLFDRAKISISPAVFTLS